MKSILALSLFFACAAGAAHTATYNSISISTGSCGEGQSNSITNSATSVDASVNSGSASCASVAEAYAGGGVVGVSAHFSATPGPGGQGTARASARTLSNELTISIADGYNREALVALYGLYIPISLSLNYEGQMSTALETGSFYTQSAQTTFQGDAYLASSSGRDSGSFYESVGISNNSSGGPDSQFVSGSIDLSINQHIDRIFSVNFGMSTTATVAGGNVSTAFGNTNAMNSFSFASSGPVFDLPEGFTIFSADDNIVDNRWVDPRIVNDPDPSPVPLPASLPLLLVGGLALRLVKRSKR